MKVQDVMTSNVATIAPDTPFKDIVELLARRGISGLPVVDDDGMLVGIVTENDLLAKEAYGARARKRRFLGFLLDVLAGRDPAPLSKASGLCARDLMTSKLVTVGPEDDITIAARRMLDRGIKRLPVVTDGVLVGIVARTDLLRVFDRSDASIHRSVTDLLVRCLFTPPDADVDVDIVEGVVTLRGHVHYRSDVGVLGAIVEAVEGVVGVVNEVTFSEEDPDRIGWMG